MKKSDLNLLLALAGVIVFAALYFGVHGDMSMQADTLQRQIDPLEDRLAELQAHYDKLPEYEEGIENLSAFSDSQLEFYPTMVLEEDFLIWSLNWENNVGHEIFDVSFGNTEQIMEFPLYVMNENSRELVDAYAYKDNISVSGTMTYEQLKSSLDYIYNTELRTSLDTLNVSYDSSTGQLAGNYEITKYSVMHPYAEYEPVAMPQTALGISELFGTLDVPTVAETEAVAE